MSITTGVNKVILFGEITSEPVFGNVKSVTQGCSFTIVTHEMVKRGNEKVLHAETHQIKASKLLIEPILGKLQAGGKMYLEGRVETISYTDADGVRRYDTWINATRIEFPGLAIAG